MDQATNRTELNSELYAVAEMDELVLELHMQHLLMAHFRQERGVGGMLHDFGPLELMGGVRHVTTDFLRIAAASIARKVTLEVFAWMSQGDAATPANEKLFEEEYRKLMYSNWRATMPGNLSEAPPLREPGQPLEQAATMPTPEQQIEDVAKARRARLETTKKSYTKVGLGARAEILYNRKRRQEDEDDESYVEEDNDTETEEEPEYFRAGANRRRKKKKQSPTKGAKADDKKKPAKPTSKKPQGKGKK